MSFSGEYATLSRQNPVELAVVLEVVLNEATWDTGDGTLTTSMNLSDKAVRARTRAYDPRVVKGGWTGLRQRLDLRATGLSGLSTSVTVADPDARVRDAIVNGNNRQSAATILRVIQGSDDDYDTRFTGLLDSWDFSTNQVRLNFKTDERSLRANFPSWPYLKSEWFQMNPEVQNKYAALIYGKHDSTGLNLTHGMVPTVPVWVVEGSIAWYATNLGPATLIKDVYVGEPGVLEDPTLYGPVYTSLAGGKTFTMIVYDGANTPDQDNVVTANVYGYSLVNDGGASGLYDGTNVVINPVTQIRHFLINFAVNRSRGYNPGAWDMTDALIDTASWDAAATWADNHGLEGSRYMDTQTTALSRFGEWCESFPMFRPYWDTTGKIVLSILSADWPGNWDGTKDVIRREDTIGSAYEYSTDAGDVTGKISAHYLRDSVESTFLRTLDVQDLSVSELEDTSIDMFWAPARVT